MKFEVEYRGSSLLGLFSAMAFLLSLAVTLALTAVDEFNLGNYFKAVICCLLAGYFFVAMICIRFDWSRILK